MTLFKLNSAHILAAKKLSMARENHNSYIDLFKVKSWPQALSRFLVLIKHYGFLVNSPATATDDWWLCHSPSFSSNLQLHVSSHEHQLILFLFYWCDILLHSTFFSHSLQHFTISTTIHLYSFTSYPSVFFFFKWIKVNYSICTHNSILSCLHTPEVTFFSSTNQIFLLSTKLFLSP